MPEKYALPSGTIGKREPDETVAAHLQHDGRQDDRSAGRCLNVRVRKPGVNRPHWHFDGESQQECNEDQLLLTQRQRQLHEVEKVEGAGLVVQVDKCHQHQHGTEERIQEEFQRRVDAAFTTPHADDQEHRHQHGFPQDVEQNAIERREHANHQSFQYQEGGEILCRTNLDDVPAGYDHQWRDECRQ